MGRRNHSNCNANRNTLQKIAQQKINEAHFFVLDTWEGAVNGTCQSLLPHSIRSTRFERFKTLGVFSFASKFIIYTYIIIHVTYSRTYVSIFLCSSGKFGVLNIYMHTLPFFIFLCFPFLLRSHR